MTGVNRQDLDFGARIKHAREERGVTLRQIADATKISVSVLEALERNDFSRLPGGIFSRAFVRSYAAEIGVDPEQTVREFVSQFPRDSLTASSQHEIDEDLRAGGTPRLDRRALMLLGTVVLVVAAILFWSLRAAR